jgi:hypothetical protein
MKEISREKLETRIDNFKERGWIAYIVEDSEPERKLYVEETRGRRYNEMELKMLRKSSSRTYLDAIRFMNLVRQHYNRFPELWKRVTGE